MVGLLESQVKMKRIGLILLCGIAVSAAAAKNSHDKHESVDLGLSVRWATTNVGARKPSDYGAYYAWAEVTSKEFFSSGNYRYGNGEPYTKYELREWCSTYDGRKKLAPGDDAATANWGNGWRMPTKKEMEELIACCTWEWTTVNGVYGAKVYSKADGLEDQYIFLPASGCMDGNEPLDRGDNVQFWTSNPNGVSAYHCKMFKVDDPEDIPLNMFSNRCLGMTIRPVRSLEENDFKSISLGSDIDMAVGGTNLIKVITTPEHPVDGGIFTWETSDPAVVTVTETGMVTAMSAGTCCVTARIGNMESVCRINVTIVEPEAVDLGLSVLWSSANVGALTPYEPGGMFYKDETEPYEWLLEKGWRLPTYTEYEELEHMTHSNWRYNVKMADSLGMECYCYWRFSEMTEYEDRSIVIVDLEDYYGEDTYYPFYFRVTADGSEPSDFDYDMKRNPLLPVRLVRDYRPGDVTREPSIMVFDENVCIEPGEVRVEYALAQPGMVADNTMIEWVSSDARVATVKDGVITAVSAGMCTVTASYGGASTSCSVTVVKPGSGQSDYQYVDLGLSVKWATANVGSTPENVYGETYQYGKPMLDIHDYIERNRYNIDSDTADVASFNWGGDWRLPSSEEMQELIDSCDWAMDESGGIKGWRVTSRKEGYADRSIFLPYRNSYANYMCGDIAMDWSKEYTRCASLYITESPAIVSDSSGKSKKVHYLIQEPNRTNSYYVRPVRP